MLSFETCHDIDRIDMHLVTAFIAAI